MKNLMNILYFYMFMLTLSQILTRHDALHHGDYPLHGVLLRVRHHAHGGEAAGAAAGAGRRRCRAARRLQSSSLAVTGGTSPLPPCVPGRGASSCWFRISWGFCKYFPDSMGAVLAM